MTVEKSPLSPLVGEGEYEGMRGMAVKGSSTIANF